MPNASIVFAIIATVLCEIAALCVWLHLRRPADDWAMRTVVPGSLAFAFGLLALRLALTR